MRRSPGRRRRPSASAWASRPSIVTGCEPVQGPQPARRVALLDLRQRLHGAEVVRLRLAGDPRGERVRGGCPRGRRGPRGRRPAGTAPRPAPGRAPAATSRWRSASANAPTLTARRAASSSHGDRLVRAAAVEPVPGDQGRRGAARGEPAGGVAVHRDPVVRRDLLDQRLADQVVPEAVAGVGDDQRAGRRGRRRAARTRRARPARSARARRPGRGRRRPPRGGAASRAVASSRSRNRAVTASQTDRGTARPRPGADAAGQLQGEERVALRQLDDPGESPARVGGRAGPASSATISSRSSGPRSIATARPARSSAGDALGQEARARLGAVGERRPGAARRPCARASWAQASTVASSARCASSTTSRTPVASGRGHEQPVDGADHHVPGEPGDRRRRRCGQRGQLGQRRADLRRTARRAGRGRGPSSCSTASTSGAYGPAAGAAP